MQIKQWDIILACQEKKKNTNNKTHIIWKATGKETSGKNANCFLKEHVEHTCLKIYDLLSHTFNLQ